ncbi:MAG: hypothetical protein Q4F56_02650 [Candidatus Saccharibacteria bacterium]|nr:hypothetical protein [Candidatus Saccharibacteria bacterium]
MIVATIIARAECFVNVATANFDFIEVDLARFCRNGVDKMVFLVL